MHKKKVADVRQWLETSSNGLRQKVLVLKGAAGTGKTTTVRLLAKDLDLGIMEWKNPGNAESQSEGSGSAASQFEDFVGRAGRSTGLKFSKSDDHEFPTNVVGSLNDENPPREQSKVLLVEEFPNTYSRSSNTLQSFRSAILQYLSSPALSETKPTPIVMVISETLLSTNTALADSFTAHRLLGPELANHPLLNTIEFNAVAPTIITKALETIVLKEARKSGRRRTPGPQVLKRLAECGDLRSAVSSLEFLCLRGDNGDTWSSKVTFTKQKKAKSDPPLTQAEEHALKLISNRESTLGIFHAVGKVVYNKRTDAPSIAHPPPWLPQYRRNKVPETNVNELVDEVGTDTSTFNAALHENYALSCSSSSTDDTLDSLMGCIDNISDADLLSVDRFSLGTRPFSGSSTDSLRQDEIAFQVAVRGLLFSLPHPVHRATPADGKKSDANLMFYPSSLKLWKKREETEGILDLLTSKYQADPLTSASQTRNNESKTRITGDQSWQRNSSIDMNSVEQHPNDETVRRSNSAKMEMLIERLPYVTHIMSSKTASSNLMEQLTAVTRIRRTVSANDDDDADIGESGETVEQWTTDRPDNENPSKLVGVKSKPKHHAKNTDGGGLGIPVESRVENLVLEEDDIED